MTQFWTTKNRNKTDLVLNCLCCALVDTSNHGVISLEGLKGKLLLGLDALLSHLLHLTGEDGLGGSGRVDTVGLDGNKDTTADLQEQVGVKTDDTGLIGLSNIGEDAVDHADEHAVLEGVTGVLDNGDNVGAVSSHVDQVTAGTVRELDGVDGTGGTDDISDVRNGGTGGGTEVEDLGAGLHVDVLETTEDTGGNLRTEGVPDTVLDLCGSGSLAVFDNGCRRVDSNALLTIDGDTRGHALCAQHVLLAASDKDTGVSVGLL